MFVCLFACLFVFNFPLGIVRRVVNIHLGYFPFVFVISSRPGAAALNMALRHRMLFEAIEKASGTVAATAAPGLTTPLINNAAFVKRTLKKHLVTATEAFKPAKLKPSDFATSMKKFEEKNVTGLILDEDTVQTGYWEAILETGVEGPRYYEHLFQDGSNGAGSNGHGNGNGNGNGEVDSEVGMEYLAGARKILNYLVAAERSINVTKDDRSLIATLRKAVAPDFKDPHRAARMNSLEFFALAGQCPECLFLTKPFALPYQPSPTEQEHSHSLGLLIRCTPYSPSALLAKDSNQPSPLPLAITHVDANRQIVSREELNLSHFLHPDLRALLLAVCDDLEANDETHQGGLTLHQLCCACHKFELQRGFKTHPHSFSTLMWLYMDRNPIKVYFEWLKGQLEEEEATDDDDDDENAIGSGSIGIDDAWKYLDSLEYTQTLSVADTVLHAHLSKVRSDSRALHILSFADFVTICVEADCNCSFLCSRLSMPWTPNPEEELELKAVMNLAKELTNSSTPGQEEAFLSAKFLSAGLRTLIQNTLTQRRAAGQEMNLQTLFFNTCHKHQLISDTDDYACLLNVGPGTKEFYQHLALGSAYEDTVSTRRIIDFLGARKIMTPEKFNAADLGLMERLQGDVKARGERQMPFLEFTVWVNDFPGNAFLVDEYEPLAEAITNDKPVSSTLILSSLGCLFFIICFTVQ
jgi:hypothetical protein